MHSEHELIELAKTGNRRAFQSLVKLNSGKMYGAAYRILNSQQLAEDCVQEAFLKMYLKLESFNHQSKFSTWLYTVTVNVALDMRRKNTKQDCYDEYDFEQLPSRDDNAPEKAVWMADINNAMQNALAMLSDDVRVAFVLRHYQECSIDEISQILGVNSNTVKSRIFRGVARLRELLQTKVYDYETVE